VSWRLVCDVCTRRLGEEIKSIGILEHPDVRCASCGVFIRSAKNEFPSDGRWFPVTGEQLFRLQIKVGEPDDELHYGFVLDEDEEALGAAQDEVCRDKTVRCVVHEGYPEKPESAHVVQIYMNDPTPRPVWAGTVWRYGKFPTKDEVKAALARWRGPGGPEFIVEWYKE